MKRLVILFVLIVATVGSARAQSVADVYKGDSIDKAESRQIQIQHHLRNLRHQDYTITEESIGKLIKFGSDSIPPLVRIAMDKNQDKHYRLNAIYALGRMGKLAENSAKLIAGIVFTPDIDYQATAAGALGRIGARNLRVYKALEHLLEHHDKWVRNSAETALKRIGGPKAREILKAYELAQNQKEVAK